MALITCRDCSKQFSDTALNCPSCGWSTGGSKSKVVAFLLAWTLGGIGIHKFYLGRVGWGIMYLIFCWTFVPAFMAFIEGIIYLCMSEYEFNYKYNRS